MSNLGSQRAQARTFDRFVHTDVKPEMVSVMSFGQSVLGLCYAF